MEDEMEKEEEEEEEENEGSVITWPQVSKLRRSTHTPARQNRFLS